MHTKRLKNMLRHFIVGLGAITYLTWGFALLYQYLGVINGWPGVFLRVVHESSGDWWLDVDWSSPVLVGTFVCTTLAALVYAIVRRNDYLGYRESQIPSQSGF
jgi:NhaP-type Na+/H+ and K+/H+ antiporter